jgi:aryl-alcohol dehydrogenase-like predicted oxidoreductase
MEYRRVGRSGLRVSEVCLGTMTFGMRDWGCDEKTSHAILDHAVGAGVNFIDTADIYAGGGSEEILGRWMKGKRPGLVIATKVFFPTGPGPNDRGTGRVHVRQAIEASLRRMETDYVDLYQVHCWDRGTPLEETLGVLTDLVREGKTRYIGCSNYAGWQIEKAVRVSEREGLARFDCLQPQYSLVVRDIEREILPVCREEGLGVIPWSPLGAGFLTGKYRRADRPPAGTRLANWEDTAQRHMTDRNFELVDLLAKIGGEHGKPVPAVALRWLLDVPGVTAPIVGARTVAQLEQSLQCAGWTLTPEEFKAIDRASRIEERMGG